jgi:GGDEF domain-containing protein
MMTVSIDPLIPSLVARLLERRTLTLFNEVRDERAEIAERMSADGNRQSSGFIVAVTRAFTNGFESFARGSTQDVLALMRQPGGRIDASLGTWVKEQLEPAFERVAEQMCGEVGGGGPLSAVLQSSMREAMEMSLAAIKRDLGIELDTAAIAQAPPAPVIDTALLDPLVPLQNSHGLELEFQARSKDSDEPIAFAYFDIDKFKKTQDAHGGHGTGDEVLVSVAQIAAACIKGKGSAYRLHGEAAHCGVRCNLVAI